ncbi:MAG: box helicase protein box helicase protein [Candidatus Taylorbacteria bacterium]|nr:box helicase protein box helicase protein [Candidatus Taylorbacteria bacterium]
MRKITFDIETRDLFQDVGSNDPAALTISVVCIHDSAADDGTGKAPAEAGSGYSSYLVEDLPKLWPIMEQADMLITFNGDHFDIPLLNKYYTGDLTKVKSLDLMAEVKKSLGRRIKLDTLAEATLGRNKSGHGLEAIAWWKSGEIDKIIKYCLEDVKITKELYEYALKNKHLKYKDLGAIVVPGKPNANIRDIKLDTTHWETKSDHAMTFTLPF